jgi:hypothetical protein
MYNRNIYPSSMADPRSNTGSDSQTEISLAPLVEARIDALTILWAFSPDCLIDIHIRDWLDIQIDTIDSIGRKIGVWWDRNYHSATGTLYSQRDCANGRIECRLSISGEDCGRLGNSRVIGFMRWCRKNLLNLRCSRIDLFVDDYSKKLKFDNLSEAIKNKNRSGFKKGRCIRDYGGKHEGWTAYLGRRESERMIRVYDKFAESSGMIDAIRWEAEIKGKMANSLFPIILEFPENPEELQQGIINYAIGKVSFINPIDKNVSRCPLLEWWKEWLEMLKCAPKKVFVSRPETTLARTKQWMEHSVSKSLVMLKDGLGIYYFQHFMDELMAIGKSKMKNIDLLKVKDFQRNYHDESDIIGHPIKIMLQV